MVKRNSPSPYGGLLTVDSLHCHRDFITGEMHHFAVDDRKPPPHTMIVDSHGYARPPNHIQARITRPSNMDNPTTRELKMQTNASINQLVAGTPNVPYDNATFEPCDIHRTCQKTFAELKREKDARSSMWSPCPYDRDGGRSPLKLNPMASWKVPSRVGVLNTPPLKIPSLRPSLRFSAKTWGPPPHAH